MGHEPRQRPALSCESCNIAKGTLPIEVFLANKPEVLKRILAQVEVPLKDTAAANLDVASGQILAPSIGPTRTEADFVAHIKETIQMVSQVSWVFIANQLNTHQSETLICLMAQLCGIQQDLGENSQKRPSDLDEDASYLSL